MKTLRFKIDPDEIGSAEAVLALEQAAAILRDGGTVALPTETVYGLGANALDALAVGKIFEAKERPGWDPLIVHVADEAMMAEVVARVPESARRLMDAFWPGPLTMLMPRSELVPDAVTAGRPLVGVRMPAHAVALALIQHAGVPVAAPSANRFGRTSPTTAEHVLEDLDGRIDALVDAGPTQFGVESTVLDVTCSPMIVYRPGAVTIEQIRAVAGMAEMYLELDEREAMPRRAMPSPGVGLRHYAPRAKLILIEAEDDKLGAALSAEALKFGTERVGVMLPANLKDLSEFGTDVALFDWGKWSDPALLARRLFAGLRYLDMRGCAVIVCPVPKADGLGAAIRDRLRKAAWKA